MTIGINALAKVNQLAGRPGTAHIGATTQAGIRQGGRLGEVATSTGQEVGKFASDTMSSYTEKQINKVK